MNRTADDWIEHLGLIEHPEGGYFRETYRSTESIEGGALPARYLGRRSFSTAIYFLLRGGQISHLHRLRSDEIWHYHAGSAVTVHCIEPGGACHALRLGGDPERGEELQGVIPAGWWFGATVDDPDSYTLVGCTVAPGFDFADFEIGRREDLLRLYPEHRNLIESLTSE